MKPTLILLILMSNYSLTLAQPSPVLDTDGEILLTGVDYYILPVLRGRGGGVSLGSTRNETCPLDVVQEPSELENGLPFTFTPADPNNGVINESTDLNIKFSGPTICAQSTVWTLENYEGQRIVTTGGVEGNPGRETLGNWFGFQKFENDYKIYYCPTVCATCRPECGDILISVKNGNRRLVVIDITDVKPFLVKFKKA